MNTMRIVCICTLAALVLHPNNAETSFIRKNDGEEHRITRQRGTLDSLTGWLSQITGFTDPSTRCTCTSCSDAVWNALAGGLTCGSRIAYLTQQESNWYPSTASACHRIASIEYPAICGACDPSTCDERTPPPPSNDFYCGCESCTRAPWKSDVGDGSGLSCEAHITWLETHESMNEEAACRIVATQFPASSCKSDCDPATCNISPVQVATDGSSVQVATNGSPVQAANAGTSTNNQNTSVIQDLFGCATHCTCNSCDTSAWGTIAGGISCGDRIQHLQLNTVLYPSENAACAHVGGIEFPVECGACNPASCDGKASTQPPTKSQLTKQPATSPQTTILPPVSSKPIKLPPTTSQLNTPALRSPTKPPSSSQAATHSPVVSQAAKQSAVASQASAGSPVATQATTRSPMASKTKTRSPVASQATARAPATSQVTTRAPVASQAPTQSPMASQATRSPVASQATTPSPVVSQATTRVPMASQATTRSPVASQATSPSPVASQATSSSPAALQVTSPSRGSTKSSFGANVMVFDTTMSTSTIQAAFDNLLAKQVDNEMGLDRYSMFFLPGTYGTSAEPLELQFGYYTEVAGLGASPKDVIINGKIEVFNRCFQPDAYNAGQFIPTSATNGGLCFALNNFWRSLSNLSINIVHKQTDDQCRQTAMFWAISQASSFRRVDVNGGDLSLMDYCSTPAFASGGFIADSRHADGKVINGSQQQFLSRNMIINQWDAGVWNQVFLGVDGAPKDTSFPDPPFTVLDTTPLSREKPYIFVDNAEYFVRVPSVQTQSSGVSWASGLTDGTTLSLSDFYVAKPTDTVAMINTALSGGKHLLLTPGIYYVDESIVVSRAGTIVLGLGLATFSAKQGATALKILDLPGVIVSGVIFDAGSVESPVLLQVGDPKSTKSKGDPSKPITLHDVYFRVGGPYVGKANICLEINSNHVLVDNTWIWRADHGVEGFNEADGFQGDNERWITNIARNGLVVNGDNVTITGLFVEHFQEYNVLWNGEGGRVFFFQNELPYDPPTQKDWIAADGKLGWAGYKVSDSVTEHELHGAGVYCYNRNNPSIITESGFEVPSNVPGIKMKRVYTRSLSGPGTINYVINGVGNKTDSHGEGPNYVLAYPSSI